MSDLRIRTAVPIVRPDNSIYIQAKLWTRAIRDCAECEPEVIASSAIPSGGSNWLTLYHYGSFDWAAFLLARQRAVFVYHNVTQSKYLWRWNPLVALRSLAAVCQLALLPKDLPWLAVSQFNRESLLKKGFTRVKVVPCVVPEPRRAPKTARPSMLFVGRISPSKSVLQLLECYKRVVDLMADDPPQLTIVGVRKRRCRYGDAFERELAMLCKKYPVVWHREPLSYSDLQALYSSSWVYVTASRHEGFAVPVMEAICAGTAALYIPCGGTEAELDRVGCVASMRDLPAVIHKHLTDVPLRQKLLDLQTTFMPELRSGAVVRKLMAALEDLGFSGVEIPRRMAT